MKLVSSSRMRELDRRAIEEYGVAGDLLMDRAGKGVADTVCGLARVSSMRSASVLLIAGRGNNGGDAFAAARHLAAMGFRVEVRLASDATRIGGDALTHLRRMLQAGIPLTELPEERSWDTASARRHPWDIAVDGVLGTGISGTVRGVAARAISFINAVGTSGLVVSIDVPSGLDADTGEPMGDAVVADITVTMGLPKIGLISSRALEYVGAVEVVDIGIPEELANGIESAMEGIGADDLRPLFRRRPRASHKGSYGHVLLIGGAAGYSGAITLAARAAVRSGAGLVSVVTPKSIAPIVASGVPEAMVHGVRETDSGSLSADLRSQWPGDINRFDAILAGPGMTAGDQSRLLVEELLTSSKAPLVLDADALNVQKLEDGLLKRASCSVVITPHPGELARFLNRSVADVQSGRIEAAKHTAAKTGATVILKGAGTVVAGSDGRVSVNMNGNAGMATGGMGDVLAGLLAGLLGQRLPPFDAARAAVYLHGRAGDLAAWRSSQPGLVAGDVVEQLPLAFRGISAR